MIEKLTILRESDVINENAFGFAVKAYEEAKKYSESEEKINMFITHLAMATMRIIRGDIVEADAEELKTSVKLEVGEKVFALVDELWNKMKKHSPIVFPDSEDAFIYLHLCNVFNE
ncbi:MAG: PRD domain-containing protein [Acholeplasma sp.]|nr:PRD domain-containing protein [Acholeplasma sp.]